MKYKQYLKQDTEALLPTTHENSSTTANNNDTSNDSTQQQQSDEVVPIEETKKDWFAKYFSDPTVEWITELQANFWIFHTRAPIVMIVSMWLMWALSLAGMIFGFYQIYEEPQLMFTDWFYSYNVDQDYISYSWYYFMVSVCTISVMFFALEGTLFPIKWFFSAYIFYPFSCLTYGAACIGIVVTYTVGAYRYNLNRYRQP